jgi:hypothetical protein
MYLQRYATAQALNCRHAVQRMRICVHPVIALLVFVGMCDLFVTDFTRAISIGAPPSPVWPWLLAIGQDRAGFLSNDYLENLAGGDIHNSDNLRADWHQRDIGDRVPMAGEAERKLAGDYTLLTVRIMEPERVIGDIPGRFVLQPLDDGGTRLLLREPLAIPERAGLAGFLTWGWRWCAPYLLLASTVAFILLLAPHSYAAFGIIFLVVVAGLAFARRAVLASWMHSLKRQEVGAGLS